MSTGTPPSGRIHRSATMFAVAVVVMLASLVACTDRPSGTPIIVGATRSSTPTTTGGAKVVTVHSPTAAAPAVTQTVAVDPFTTTGTLKPGWTVSPNDVGDDYVVECYGSSASAVVGAVWDCGTTADDTHNCWAPPSAPGYVWCVPQYQFDETRHELVATRATFSGATANPSPPAEPFAFRTTDGSQWFYRVGGAWDLPPDGYAAAYGCSRGPCTTLGDVAVVADERGSSNVTFDRSTPAWTVKVAQLGSHDPAEARIVRTLTVATVWDTASPF